jgi:CheY-like chemotaxis protein
MLSDSHQVTLSRSGDEARRILDEQVFDVVVCDLMMPNVSGMDLYDRLQRTRPEMAQRVVFMTGGAFTERARRFVERVDNVCLGKPFNVLELRRAVERLGSLDEPAN